MMLPRIYSLISLILAAVSCFSQENKLQYTGNEYKCSYGKENGMFSGKYTSWYSNGKKKAEGTFRDNLKTGVWTVWDSLGRMRCQRNYQNLFEYDQPFPKIAKEGPCQLLNTPLYQLTYNKDGYIDYFKIREKDVVAAKRIWRIADPTANPRLAGPRSLYEVLYDAVSSGRAKAYNKKSDEFIGELTKEEAKQAGLSQKVTGYMVKEDWFFDDQRLLSEIRIIGIAPVIVTPKDTTVLFWIYYPEFRKILAGEKTGLVNNGKAMSLDDVFTFRRFSSTIYKESNVYDRSISEYKSGDERLKESERIELDMINMEMDLLVFYNSGR